MDIFSDLYCLWQRECTENSNGLLRAFYPKKTDISKIETEDLLRTLILINSKSRKCLSYITPFEKFSTLFVTDTFSNKPLSLSLHHPNIPHFPSILFLLYPQILTHQILLFLVHFLLHLVFLILFLTKHWDNDFLLYY